MANEDMLESNSVHNMKHFEKRVFIATKKRELHVRSSLFNKCS